MFLNKKRKNTGQELIMGLKTTIIIASSLIAFISLNNNVMADVNFKPKPQLKPQFKLKPQLFILPEIKNVKHSCTGGSMSSAKLSVTATVFNKNTKPQTYKTGFVGMKAGECIQHNSDHCIGQPSDYLCMPKCTKQAPPTMITVKGDPVTVPGKGQRSFSIITPTHLYVQGTRVNVGGAKAMVLPVPIAQCLH